MMISAEELRAEELRLRYRELLVRPDVFPTEANWQFIISRRMPGLASLLYQKYLVALTIDDNDRDQLHDVAVEQFPEYISAIDRREAIDALYSDVTTSPDKTAALIRKNNLFDASALIGLIDDGEVNFALSVIDVYQPDYSEEDVEQMEHLMYRLDSLPRHGYVEQRGGIFGASERYICPDGHSNPADTEYCRHSGCGKNARGLSEKQEKAISLFISRISVLKSMFETK